METKIVSKAGGKIGFHAVSDGPISIEDAEKAQTRLGYNPMGYGLEGFKSVKMIAGVHYEAYWYCYTSCD